MESTHNGFDFRVVDDAASDDFAALYALYDKVFTLPEEKDSADGFRTAMAFNHDSRLQEHYGPFAEMWLSATDSHGHVAGGINFDIFHIPSLRCSTMHIVYIFSRMDCRGHGLATGLLEEAETVARSWLASHGLPDAPLYMFCEQNAPELMSAAEYKRDSDDAGIDPCDRLMWWHRRGFRRLAINYVQPPLDDSGEPCRTLTLNIRSRRRAIPSAIIAEHLRRFLYISVLKNRCRRSEVAEKVIEEITRTATVRTEGNMAYYRRLKREVTASGFTPRISIH